MELFIEGEVYFKSKNIRLVDTNQDLSELYWIILSLPRQTNIYFLWTFYW